MSFYKFPTLHRLQKVILILLFGFVVLMQPSQILAAPIASSGTGTLNTPPDDQISTMVSYVNSDSVNRREQIFYTKVTFPGSAAGLQTLFSTTQSWERLYGIKQNYSSNLDPSSVYYDYIISAPSTVGGSLFYEAKVDVQSLQSLSLQSVSIPLTPQENFISNGSPRFSVERGRINNALVTFYAYGVEDQTRAQRIVVSSFPQVKGPYIISGANLYVDTVDLRLENDALGNTQKILVYYANGSVRKIERVEIDLATGVISTPVVLAINSPVYSYMDYLDLGQKYLGFSSWTGNMYGFYSAYLSSPSTNSPTGWSPIIALPSTASSVFKDLIDEAGDRTVLLGNNYFSGNRKAVQEMMLNQGAIVRSQQLLLPYDVIDVAVPKNFLKLGDNPVDLYVFGALISSPSTGMAVYRVNQGVLSQPVIVPPSTSGSTREINIDVLQ